MSDSKGTIYVVDDDSSMRKAMGRLCVTAGWRVHLFASAREFLDHGAPESPGCLLLDVSMPGLTGLDLQTELAARQIHTPVVFVTGHGDIPTSVKAIKAGAVDFLTKPFQERNVLQVVREALRKDAQQMAEQMERETIRRRLESLTRREKEVLDLVIQGMLNKQIAAELGAGEQTIKVHRGRVMEKMGVNSVAELVQAALKIRGGKP